MLRKGKSEITSEIRKYQKNIEDAINRGKISPEWFKNELGKTINQVAENNNIFHFMGVSRYNVFFAIMI